MSRGSQGKGRMQCENAESHEKTRPDSEYRDSRDQIPGRWQCGQREESEYIEELHISRWRKESWG